MLPVIPFEILVPLTIAATALCLGLIAMIIVRRALLKWYSRDGNRLTDEAVFLLRRARIGKGADSLVSWLGRTRAARIEGLVRAVDRMEGNGPQMRGWLVENTAVPERLAEIVAAQPNGKRVRMPTRWTRVAAAKAAASLRFDSVTPALIGAMDDPDPEVGYAAADALARLNQPAGADAILQRITSQPKLNNSRLAALVEAMNCDLTPLLREHLSRSDVQALFWTATLIGTKQIFDLVTTVRPLLQSEDANVRAAACECIGELNIRLTDRWLEPLLDDEKWFVQSHAAKALGDLRATWATPHLAQLLSSNEWWVRQNAADALVQIGAASAEPVEPLLSSPDKFARNTAVEILHQIGWIETVLQRLLRGDVLAEPLLRQFGLSGGLGYLENSLFYAPEETISILLEILRDQGDDATYGRVRAAAEQMPEALRPLAYAVAGEVKGR